MSEGEGKGGPLRGPYLLGVGLEVHELDALVQAALLRCPCLKHGLLLGHHLAIGVVHLLLDAVQARSAHRQPVEVLTEVLGAFPGQNARLHEGLLAFDQLGQLDLRVLCEGGEI